MTEIELCCPACHSAGAHLLEWSFSGFNDSVFNYAANFCNCRNCGLVWVSNITDDELRRFYEEECGYFDSSHFDIRDPRNIAKFDYYKNILNDAGVCDLPVVDVGCGRGGFVSWLMHDGWGAECVGVDIDVKSLPVSEGDGPKFVAGSAIDLPHADNTQKVLTYFHVFEHILDTDSILCEASRVLEEGGLVIVEVPDAQGYCEHPISGGFWPSIREHIYHFSAKSLTAVLMRNGFSVVSIKQNEVPTPEFSYRSLIAVARKGGGQDFDYAYMNNSVADFFCHSRGEIVRSADRICNLATRYTSVVFWGISNQLLSILPVLEKGLGTFVLCDSSAEKQRLRYKNQPILAPADCCAADSLLVVSSFLHKNAIRQAACDFGWDIHSIVDLVE